jgi:hypothetical protein
LLETQIGVKLVVVAVGAVIHLLDPSIQDPAAPRSSNGSSALRADG